MSEPFVGEIRFVAFDFEPGGYVTWAPCDGATLKPADNPTLFAVIGATFGGDGRNSFNLPDMRGRAPVHFNLRQSDADTSFIPYILTGEVRGAEQVALLPEQIPVHNHRAQGATTPTGDNDARWPTQSILRAASLHNTLPYATNATDSDLVLSRQSFVKPVGSGSETGFPHTNMQPYQVVNAITAVDGVFPRRSGGAGSLGVFQELPNGAVHQVSVAAPNTSYQKRVFLRNNSEDTLRIPAIWSENAHNVNAWITSDDEFLAPGEVTQLIIGFRASRENAFRFDVRISFRRMNYTHNFGNVDVDPDFVQVFSVYGTVDTAPMAVFTAMGARVFADTEAWQGAHIPSDAPQTLEFLVENTYADKTKTLTLQQPAVTTTSHGNIVSAEVTGYTQTPITHGEMGSVFIQYTPAADAAFTFKVDLPIDDANVTAFSVSVAGRSLPVSTSADAPAVSAPETVAPQPATPDGGSGAGEANLKAGDQPPKLRILALLDNTGSFPRRAGLANHPHSFSLTMMPLGVLGVGLNAPTIQNATNVKNVSITSPSDFLQPEQTSSVVVTYTPTSTTEDFSFDIIETANDDGDGKYDIKVTGRAVQNAPVIAVTRDNMPIANGAYDFQGTVPVNKKQTVIYSVRNDGNFDLTVTSVQTLHQANAIAAVINPPSAIEAGQSADVTVEYTPTTTLPSNTVFTDAFAFDLRLDTNDADATPFVITINGVESSS